MKSFLRVLTPNILLISRRFKIIFGYYPNLFAPKSFNEKIAYRMLHPKDIYSPLSDKIAVREYVSNLLGGSYLIPMIWNGKHLSESDFKSLPNSFVIKANHASGTNLIVRDKSKIDYNEIKSITEDWLRIDFHDVNLEKHYKYIDRALIAEELLTSESGGIPYDYKVHVFNSESGPKLFIQVDYDRFDEVNGHTRDIYDENWKLVPLEIAYRNSGYKEERPNILEEMLEASKTLGKAFSYSRIDWYICSDKLYFGEITFTHGCATEQFTPHESDLAWGKMWDLKYDK